MEKLKDWFKNHKQTVIIALVVLIGGYYMYLTHVSKYLQINETYYASDDYSMIVLEFEDNSLSTYMISMASDSIVTRIDYQVRFRTFTEDILGNFWSDDGLEPLGLRGSDIAGRLYAECVGSAVWAIEDEMTYYDQEDIRAMEEANDTSYSFLSRFAIKDGTLRVYDFIDLDLQQTESIPEVEAELMRLIDSLCPPEF